MKKQKKNLQERRRMSGTWIDGKDTIAENMIVVISYMVQPEKKMKNLRQI